VVTRVVVELKSCGTSKYRERLTVSEGGDELGSISREKCAISEVMVRNVFLRCEGKVMSAKRCEHLLVRGGLSVSAIRRPSSSISREIGPTVL
jgi:hypothetical protein